LGHGVERTGEYGDATENAVKSFQSDAGLTDDGLFGRNSMRALERAEMAPRPEHDALRNGVAGGRVFQNGDNGAAVVDAQRLLNSAGFRTGVDGDFGPGTEQAVRNFQAANNIQANGQIGETTLNALREVAAERAQNIDPTASTDGMNTQQRYDHYRGLIEANGGQFRTGPNQYNIVSLRQETDADANGGRGVYDDRTALVWTDSQGRPHVEEFNSNTEPSARYRNRIGVDANGDGRLDQGRLPSGYYEYRTDRSGSLGNILRPTSSTMAERDTNHDGLFNDGVSASAGRSMLFHAGGNSITGSAGCQTMRPGDYNRFWNHLHSAGNPGTIGYTLINL
jgi:peptidoglycan hydrolase-like protein with peptidoglycan-binding domain